MVDVHSDRDLTFTVSRRKGEIEEAADRLTQLGRSLRKLGTAPFWRTPLEQSPS